MRLLGMTFSDKTNFPEADELRARGYSLAHWLFFLCAAISLTFTIYSLVIGQVLAAVIYAAAAAFAGCLSWRVARSNLRILNQFREEQADNGEAGPSTV